MFDLEKSITEWRQQMLDAGIQTPVPLEELEEHLREEIERQMKSGLGEQNAFVIAVEHIGRGNLLEPEFKKAGGMDKAHRRKVAGIVYALVLVFYLLATILAYTKSGLSLNEWWLALASQATLLLSVYGLWQVAPRLFPTIGSRRAQSAVGLVGGISGAIWFLAFAYLILPHFDFTTGQLLVAISWAMVPALLLPAMAFMVLDGSENQAGRPIGS
jgi:hypothetical protein